MNWLAELWAAGWAPGFFPAATPAYLVIALVWMLVVDGIVQSWSPGLYLVLSGPATLIHETLHGLVATLTGATVTTIDPTPHEYAPGRYAIGWMSYRGGGLFAGPLIAIAPLAGLPLGVWAAEGLLTQPHSLFGGLLSLALCYHLVDAVAMFSWGDFKDSSLLGWMALLLLPLVWLFGVLVVLEFALAATGNTEVMNGLLQGLLTPHPVTQNH